MKTVSATQAQQESLKLCKSNPNTASKQNNKLMCDPRWCLRYKHLAAAKSNINTKSIGKYKARCPCRFCESSN